MHDLDNILYAISKVRIPHMRCEYDLHDIIAAALDAGCIPYRHEALVAPGRRVDFLCGAVGIEVKRGKPQYKPLLRQLFAYAESPMIAALILVADRAPSLPEMILGKRLRSLSLERLWGVAL